MTKYNLEYKGVVCLGVDWEADTPIYLLVYKGKRHLFEQIRYISQSADTDHIKYAILQFLEVVETKIELSDIVVPTEAYELYLADSKWESLRSHIVPDVNTNNDLMLKGKRKPNYKKALKYLRKVIQYLPYDMRIELKWGQENE